MLELVTAIYCVDAACFSLQCVQASLQSTCPVIGLRHLNCLRVRGWPALQRSVLKHTNDVLVYTLVTDFQRKQSSLAGGVTSLCCVTGPWAQNPSFPDTLGTSARGESDAYVSALNFVLLRERCTAIRCSPCQFLARFSLLCSAAVLADRTQEQKSEC